MKVKVDSRTKKWLREHPDCQTTVRKCEKCGLHYKPSLGHKCKKGRCGVMESIVIFIGGWLAGLATAMIASMIE